MELRSKQEIEIKLVFRRGTENSGITIKLKT